MESEPSSTPKLPLFSIPPEPTGMVVASPLHTSASVPFRWEEEPGKPRPCTTITTTNGSQPKSLDLPPRLMMIKMSSPTTVLDGPYITTAKLSSSSRRFFSSSFRLSRDKWSFDGVGNKSPDHRGQFGPMGVVDKKLDHKGRRLGLLGSWGQRSLKVKGEKEEDVGGSFVFSSSVEVVGCGEVESGKVERITRNGSLSRLSKPRSHFWILSSVTTCSPAAGDQIFLVKLSTDLRMLPAAIYEGIKQVIPWKSRKSKRGGFII